MQARGAAIPPSTSKVNDRQQLPGGPAIGPLGGVVRSLRLPKQPMPKLRYQPPERLIGATEYSEHAELRGSLNTVRLVKQQAWSSTQLRDDCDLSVNHGRKRKPGRWELAAVVFVASRHVDLQPWWDESTDELWRECGFSEKPTYDRVWERMRELGEKREGAFLDAATLVIQRCRAHDPRVFAHAHVDSTEDETHAALVHDCQPGESRPRAVLRG